jgi:hypothetical protein
MCSLNRTSLLKFGVSQKTAIFGTGDGLASVVPDPAINKS